MAFEEKCIKANNVFQGRILSVYNDDVLDGAGKPCKRECIKHPGGACALYVEGGKVAFVKQYRYVYGEEVLELPAGKLEKGEDPCLAALRELAEETGITAKKEDAELLFVMYPTPGYTDEKIYIYHVKQGEQKVSNPDEGEFVETLFMPLDEVKTLLASGKLHDAKTIVALQAYLLKNNG
ncbi:MAG: NUDIX hydrolase [Clostridiales bacterium]|nr:NUDIX hydrolase [Clostridiales bacterium]